MRKYIQIKTGLEFSKVISKSCFIKANMCVREWKMKASKKSPGSSLVTQWVKDSALSHCHCCGLSLTPGLGTSVRWGFGQKKEKTPEGFAQHERNHSKESYFSYSKLNVSFELIWSSDTVTKNELLPVDLFLYLLEKPNYLRFIVFIF